jgi:pimeloyl-ACP methyl ester carboxylesterase
MPIISQQTKVALFRTYVNSLAYFSELKAGEAAIALFFKPRKGKLTDDNRQTLSSATWETLELRDMPIQTYRWEGGKNTVLLAHGWESNAARWQQLIKKLRKNGFTVVALDAPAHGESGSVYFSAILYAEMMDIVVKRFAPSAIIGHSVGGFAAAYYATQNNTPSVFRLILMASPSELNKIFDKFLGFFRASDKVRRGFYETLERAFGKPMTYFSIKELIKPLTIKGLIIHDKGDDVCTFVDAENIHANWQGSQFIATEGYGHRLQNDKVNSLVVDYLKKELSETPTFAP